MSEYFRRIDAMLAQHTMPPEYTNSYTFIYCNDCEKKCYAKFHFLYHKCVCCKGYNTKILQTLEVKEGVTLDKLNELFLPAPTAPPAVGGGTASVLDRSDAVGELLRSASVQSIRHISSATPGFSTSNISVLSAASLTDAEISASMNAAMGRRSSNADMDVARRSRRNSRSSDMDATIP
ncbi:zinc-ribbon-domain-containing protein [Chytriomyces sp. MP71]|nr:zinc-ribbon-domain-containing protein [Chytriomyces sp. MP71]